MLNTKYYKYSRILLSLILIANIFIPSQNLRAEDFDPDNYLRNPKINSEVRKLSSNAMARQVFEDNKTSFGVTNDVISFLNNLTGGQYVKQIEIIQNIPTQKWNMNFGGGWGAYEIKNVKKIVSANRSVPVTSRIATVGGNVMNALGVLSVAIDIWDGINGDNAAKLKAIAGTESLVKGYLISEYGGAGMGIAMASTAILGYTINKFYSTVLGSYSGYWWEGYSAYLNKKYRLVRGRNSWVNLAKKGNEAGINKRLYEFWDDAEINARDSYKTPGIFDKESLYAYNNYRHAFAARYYKDYVHATLKTYFSREAEKVKIKSEIKAEREFKKLQKLIDDVTALQAAIQDAEKLLEIDFITINPQKETIKIGESVMFTVLATNLAGLETNVTDEALDSKTFTGDEPGEFSVTAQYEGESATANITVVEHDCEENEEWNEDEKRCICQDGFTENSKEVCIEIKDCGDNEHFDADINDCDCDEGFAKNDKNECIAEEPEDICSIGYVKSLVSLMRMLIADNKYNETVLVSYISKFNKEINDQSSDPCNNSIIAYCYYSATEVAARM
ncbi:MAG: hypothetical protein GWP19_09190, partial [Planctomycetia bacterium]|nr:hypothetical protein [Planctomycetia bacterium]